MPIPGERELGGTAPLPLGNPSVRVSLLRTTSTATYYQYYVGGIVGNHWERRLLIVLHGSGRAKGRRIIANVVSEPNTCTTWKRRTGPIDVTLNFRDMPSAAVRRKQDILLYVHDLTSANME